ncbi:MAG: anthranilate synthase component 1 [Planctomycetota bacterium]
MSRPPLPVECLARTLHCDVDAGSVFAHLTNSGRQEESVLLECASQDQSHRGRSLLFVDPTILVECRGTSVRFEALSSQGPVVLADLAPLLPGAVFSSDRRSLAAQYAPCAPAIDLEEELLRTTPVDALRELIRRFHLHGDCVMPIRAAGIFAYDLIDHYAELPEAQSDPLRFPDYRFQLPETTLVIDHETGASTIAGYVYDTADRDRIRSRVDQLANDVMNLATDPPATETHQHAVHPIAEAECDATDEHFVSLVERLGDHITAGEVFQIVPSRTFRVPCDDPFAAFLRLREQNPSPYLFYLRSEIGTLFGASPETCVQVQGSPRRARIRPIAGTRPRGRSRDGSIDEELDRRYELDLQLDQKELAEHLMLVDLARNDVARISRPGTREVTELLQVERYSHVMHLVSNVEGILDDRYDALHAYTASMNMGTLVGAPKHEAARLLRTYEKTKRGPYGGAVGYISSDGEMDSAIVIRSALVRDGIAQIRAGAGVVADSDPQAEADETRRKASAVISALREVVR